MQKTVFKITYKNTELIGESFVVEGGKNLLCLHGAGTSNRSIYEKIRESLAEKGISTYAFDFLGWGESVGKLEETSLEDRTLQIQTVIEFLNVQKPISIIAGSMSGYNAIKLTEIIPVELLVLSAPAVYSQEAYKIPFGEKFSEIIRKEKSWDNTDAWKILEKFKGKLLILTGENDDVIPKELTQKIYDTAVNAKTREIITLKNAPHKIPGFLDEHAEELENIVNKIKLNLNDIEEVDKYAKIIWEYMLMHQTLEKADAVFALGSNDKKVAERSADLYLQGYASKIIFSGGFGKAAHFVEPEAEVFAKIAIEKGVPAEDIILEDKATNTGENVLFTQNLLKEKGLEFKSFILVQKPYMERRTFATFSKLWPGVQFSVTSPEVSFEEYSENRNWVHVMVGDLQRIKEYPAKGFQIPQEIPSDVWDAYEKLVELGFTKYLIKD